MAWLNKDWLKMSRLPEKWVYFDQEQRFRYVHTRTFILRGAVDQAAVLASAEAPTFEDALFCAKSLSFGDFDVLLELLEMASFGHSPVAFHSGDAVRRIVRGEDSHGIGAGEESAHAWLAFLAQQLRPALVQDLMQSVIAGHAPAATSTQAPPARQHLRAAI
ncbi:hypothetical protein ACG04R_16390 [Roseateles sp. BYS78W]|uniref:Uncharacterized protein n=1 Tax=Pelomonas candidula TaxID=3299025 RepID=A0ABW7HEB9_9BURK